MDIRLDLTHHCIATETKKRYNRALSDYFRHKGDAKRLEAEIECLKTALEQLDFPGLRNHCSELAGHSDAVIILSCRPDGGLALTVDGRPLDLIYLTP
ncbi:hypothetical protein JCM14469_37880 [Desulfatiferula olefinivorans]